MRCGICSRPLKRAYATLPSGVAVGPVCGQALFIAKKKQALRRKESVRVPAVVIDQTQVDWVSMLAQGA